MKLNLLVAVLVSSLVLPFAHGACGDESARTFNGDAALTLAYILKHSPISSKSSTDVTLTMSISKLACLQTNRGVLSDLMPTYACSNPHGVGAITAKSLFDALSELGVFPDATAGHVHERAKDIKCEVNKDGTGGTAINPRCTFTAAWGDECG